MAETKMENVQEVPYTQSELRELLDYDGMIGALTWRDRRTTAGVWRLWCDGKPGGVFVCLDGTAYRAKCVIWKWVYGEDADSVIVHRFGDCFDLRLTNLVLLDLPSRLRNRRLRCSNTSVSHVTGGREVDLPDWLR
jgi:hypothetical protein